MPEYAKGTTKLAVPKRGQGNAEIARKFQAYSREVITVDVIGASLLGRPLPSGHVVNAAVTVVRHFLRQISKRKFSCRMFTFCHAMRTIVETVSSYMQRRRTRLAQYEIIFKGTAERHVIRRKAVSLHKLILHAAVVKRISRDRLDAQWHAKQRAEDPAHHLTLGQRNSLFQSMLCSIGSSKSQYRRLMHNTTTLRALANVVRGIVQYTPRRLRLAPQISLYDLDPHRMVEDAKKKPTTPLSPFALYSTEYAKAVASGFRPASQFPVPIAPRLPTAEAVRGYHTAPFAALSLPLQRRFRAARANGIGIGVRSVGVNELALEPGLNRESPPPAPTSLRGRCYIEAKTAFHEKHKKHNETTKRIFDTNTPDPTALQINTVRKDAASYPHLHGLTTEAGHEYSLQKDVKEDSILSKPEADTSDIFLESCKEGCDRKEFSVNGDSVLFAQRERRRASSVSPLPFAPRRRSLMCRKRSSISCLKRRRTQSCFNISKHNVHTKRVSYASTVIKQQPQTLHSARLSFDSFSSSSTSSNRSDAEVDLPREGSPSGAGFAGTLQERNRLGSNVTKAQRLRRRRSYLTSVGSPGSDTFRMGRREGGSEEGSDSRTENVCRRRKRSIRRRSFTSQKSSPNATPKGSSNDADETQHHSMVSSLSTQSRMRRKSSTLRKTTSWHRRRSSIALGGGGGGGGSIPQSGSMLCKLKHFISSSSMPAGPATRPVSPTSTDSRRSSCTTRHLGYTTKDDATTTLRVVTEQQDKQEALTTLQEMLSPRKSLRTAEIDDGVGVESSEESSTEEEEEEEEEEVSTDSSMERRRRRVQQEAQEAATARLFRPQKAAIREQRKYTAVKKSTKPLWPRIQQGLLGGANSPMVHQAKASEARRKAKEERLRAKEEANRQKAEEEEERKAETPAPPALPPGCLQDLVRNLCRYSPLPPAFKIKKKARKKRKIEDVATMMLCGVEKPLAEKGEGGGGGGEAPAGEPLFLGGGSSVRLGTPPPQFSVIDSYTGRRGCGNTSYARRAAEKESGRGRCTPTFAFGEEDGAGTPPARRPFIVFDTQRSVIPSRPAPPLTKRAVYRTGGRTGGCVPGPPLQRDRAVVPSRVKVVKEEQEAEVRLFVCESLRVHGHRADTEVREIAKKITTRTEAFKALRQTGGLYCEEGDVSQESSTDEETRAYRLAREQQKQAKTVRT